MRIAMGLLALALSVSACKKKETKPTGDMTGSGSGSGSAVDMGSADMGSAGSAAMAGSGSGTGSADMAGSGAGSDAAATTMTKKAGNCPSTVFGSTTKAELKGKTVVVTVTSTDKDAIASIQRRAEELLAEKKDNEKAASGHDGKGTHGGASGICPVYVPEGATATSKKDAKGVVVTITPKDKVEDLKKAIDERIPKAAEFVKTNVTAGDKGNQGGVGGGKGEHGGNHSGQGDSKGVDRKGSGGGTGSGPGTGGGGGKGTGGGKGDGK
jgi:hypothetical protein